MHLFIDLLFTLPSQFGSLHTYESILLMMARFFLSPLGCQLSAFCALSSRTEHFGKKVTCFGKVPQSLAPDLP